MKILFGLMFIFCCSNCPAQRIFYTSRDIHKSDAGRVIKAIHPHWGLGSLASGLTIVYQDGGKQKISRDSIWGFEDANRSIYRSYKGVLYQVDSLAGLIRYTEVSGRVHFRYFSKGLDTALYGTKRAARADTMPAQH